MAVSIEPFRAFVCLIVVAMLTLPALLVLSASMLALGSRLPLRASARHSASLRKTGTQRLSWRTKDNAVDIVFAVSIAYRDDEEPKRSEEPMAR